MISVLSRRCSNTLCIAGALACLSITAAHAATPEQSVSELVQRFTTAQGTFDRTALEALTFENYIEISPLGEVDPRAKMLSFYVKHDDKPLPAITVDEITPRVLGNTAIVLAKVSYAMTVGGQTRTAALRSSFVAQQQDGAWKLVSAQYTPIRPPAAPGK
jgi:ketosteroid isomerase-like protein